MNINRLIKDLKKGNNPEENLSAYSQYLLAADYRLSLGKYAIDFTQNYDLLEEDKTDRIVKSLELVTDITRRVSKSDFSCMASDIEQLNDCRNLMISYLRKLEDYLQFFELYEHIYNRLEYKLNAKPVTQSLDSFMSEVMNFVVSKKDAQTVNSRLQAIFGELPVRMTTQKFIDLMEQGAICYLGARNDMADHFFANMEKIAAPPSAKALDTQLKDLYDIANMLENGDISTLTKEERKAHVDGLDVAAQSLAKALDSAMNMLGLINHLYVILIASPYILQEDRENTRLLNILGAYIKAVENDDFLDIDEDILGGLEQAVDAREKYIGEQMLLEDCLYEFNEKYASEIQSMMLGGIYKTLCTAERLTGADIRADITAIRPYFVADGSYISKKVIKLSETFTDRFKSASQIMKRAMISMAFESMPIPFDSLDKAETFIRSSFESCTQDYEISASMQLIRELIDSDMI